MKNTKSKPSLTHLSHCTFTGVHWDASVVGAVKEVATGLRVNAEALLKLADLFKGQNVNIEAMIKISGDGAEIKGA